ncbi:unnamed protein product [Dicrocoelium dendriticum]|nr:unnamed protein product [Dicrocoelium dendriticum]
MHEKRVHTSDRKRHRHRSREHARSPFDDDEAASHPKDKRSSRKRNHLDDTRDLPSARHEDVNEGGGTGGEISLSIKESNALRAKLGLPLLELDQPRADDGDRVIDNQSERYVHCPAKDLKRIRETESLKEKIETHKEKRSLYDKLAAARLYEPAEKETPASSWVEKIREKERIKKQAQERAKLISEMDEQLEVEVPTEDISTRETYSSRDLSGLRVEHKIDHFDEGRSVILTLKDKGVLEDGDDNDVLVNVNMVDDEKAEKNRENLRKTAGLAGIEDEESEEVLLGLRKKGVLSKYDAEIQGMQKTQFTIGSEGSYMPESERLLAQLKEELRAGKHSLPDTELRVASEYYSPEELKAKFKKRTRRVKRCTRIVLTADDLMDNESLTTVPQAASTFNLENFTSRQSKTNLIEQTIFAPSTSYVPASPDISSAPIEDDDELRNEIEQTINRVVKAKSAVYVKPEDVAAQLLERKREQVEDAKRTGTSSGSATGVVFDSTAEFYKSIGSGIQETMRQHARLNQIKPEDYSDDEKPGPLLEVDWKAAKREGDGASTDGGDISDDESKPTNHWHSVIDDQYGPRPFPHRKRDASIGEPPANAHEEVHLTGVLDDEPCLDSGIFSALKLAEKKGYIEKGKEKRTGAGTMVNLMAKHFVQEDIRYDDIDAKFAKRDRYSGPLSEFKEMKNFKPDVKLEYVDELGRQLNAKEAFRQLSHKFHGKGSGKNKTEKRMKKIKEEFLLKASASSDTPLGTAEKLNKKLQSISQPYVILSGKNAAVKNLTK